MKRFQVFTSFAFFQGSVKSGSSGSGSENESFGQVGHLPSGLSAVVLLGDTVCRSDRQKWGED